MAERGARRRGDLRPINEPVLPPLSPCSIRDAYLARTVRSTEKSFGPAEAREGMEDEGIKKRRAKDEKKRGRTARGWKRAEG